MIKNGNIDTYREACFYAALFFPLADEAIDAMRDRVAFAARKIAFCLFAVLSLDSCCLWGLPHVQPRSTASSNFYWPQRGAGAGGGDGNSSGAGWKEKRTAPAATAAAGESARSAEGQGRFEVSRPGTARVRPPCGHSSEREASRTMRKMPSRRRPGRIADWWT